MLAYLLKYDSVQGAYRGHTVEHNEEFITVDGEKINIYAEPDPAKLPWKALDVDVVLECTGFFRIQGEIPGSYRCRRKKVLISAPAGNDLPTIVYGVNHETLKKDDLIVSGAAARPTALRLWQRR